MGDNGGLLGFWLPEDGTVTNGPSGVEALRNTDTGVLPYQRLLAMVKARAINSKIDIEDDQIQPASLDLRLGQYAYQVRASFLPGSSTAMNMIKDLQIGEAIDLEKGAVLERNSVYVVELMETIRLDAVTVGVANPKSSTGRLDVLTRLITDNGTAFDRIDKGYEGKLFIEIAPLTFSVVVRSGVRLNQIRLHRERGALGGVLSQIETQRHYRGGQLVRSPGELLSLRDGVLVPVTVDLRGDGSGTPIGYRAKGTLNRIDVSRTGHYDPREFWDQLESTNGRLTLEKDKFYILGTREDVGVPPGAAAEMIPLDPQSGEFRVHYAGFFDPGFGWEDGKAGGSKAVLEVRAYGVPFTLEHGQIIGWIRYSRIAGGSTERLYGKDVKSNYQGQRVALAKQFKKWPA
jgi:dCTP deaminase